MDLRNLRTFTEVVRQGGFSAAAKVIFATQSTVSKAVRQLEVEVGAPLLDRIGHKSTLTPVGEVVYRRALRLLAEREDLMTELADMRGLKSGTLRLGLPPVGSSTLFAPLFAIYRQRYPGIDIRLVEHGSDRLAQLLRAGEIELSGLLLPAPEQFEWQTVRREPMTVLMPHSLVRRRKRTADLASFKDLPFVLFEEGFAINRMILEICHKQGFEPRVVARSSQIDFIVELVSAGVGIAFMPRMIAVQQARPSIYQAQLVDPGTEWHMAMMWRRDAYLSHAARAWLQLLADHEPKRGARVARA